MPGAGASAVTSMTTLPPGCTVADSTLTLVGGTPASAESGVRPSLGANGPPSQRSATAKLSRATMLAAGTTRRTLVLIGRYLRKQPASIAYDRANTGDGPHAAGAGLPARTCRATWGRARPAAQRRRRGSRRRPA